MAEQVLSHIVSVGIPQNEVDNLLNLEFPYQILRIFYLFVFNNPQEFSLHDLIPFDFLYNFVPKTLSYMCLT